jgi:hypothetical protein
MTVEHSDIIYFVSFEPGAGVVIVTISDHLVWDENEREHLLLLQQKLNTYLEFIESGQLHDDIPGRREEMWCSRWPANFH